MALSEPVAREEMHTRRLQIKAYQRHDGLWDIEGHLIDEKPFFYDMPESPREAGEPIHDMRLRLTIDNEMVVHGAEATMDRGAYLMCQDITPNFGRLEGLKIGPGWNRHVRERLGGVHGCTHLREMLAQFATTAMQALWTAEEEAAEVLQTGSAPAGVIGSCHTYRADSPMVKLRYPGDYAGET